MQFKAMIKEARSVFFSMHVKNLSENSICTPFDDMNRLYDIYDLFFVKKEKKIIESIY